MVDYANFDNQLVYPSINIVNPMDNSFERSFLLEDGYLTIYGQKLNSNNDYEVQFEKHLPSLQFGRRNYIVKTLSLKDLNKMLKFYEEQDTNASIKWKAIEVKTYRQGLHSRY